MDRISLNRRQFALGAMALSGLGGTFVATIPTVAEATEPDLRNDEEVFQNSDLPEIEDAQTTTHGGKTKASQHANDVDPRYAKAGLTSPTTYTSPQYGYALEWTKPWSMRPPTDTWGAVVSEEKSGTDRLVLDDAKPNTAELLATLVVDTSPENDLTREVILSSEEYAKVDNTADTVVLTLIDSKKEKGAHGSTLAVWSEAYRQTIRYRLIAIDTVGDGVQRQTRLDLGGEHAEDDFAKLIVAISLDGGPILLGYTAREFRDAITKA